MTTEQEIKYLKGRIAMLEQCVGSLGALLELANTDASTPLNAAFLSSANVAYNSLDKRRQGQSGDPDFGDGVRQAFDAIYKAGTFNPYS